MPLDEQTLNRLKQLAEVVRYGGNPEHKRNPGDFGLNPPSNPRQAKTLCDEVEVFKRTQALTLLRKGLRRGLVSVQERNGWPQNIWAVAKGRALQAMLENAEQGAYHGYPLQEDDPLADEIIKRWEGSNG
ncbi:hypothetical protein [Methylomagnum ishizawai]|uniref:hypothetical protein n=1 Tax=Methylomagnum ishizawai TaxID=1760988 RepID=UPI001C33BA88|nr:hypothetical protein [Methylomagnum ishizawai]BBL73894.1 hypothetical protein MishRS11D_09920 [Methylomagnum ishizawai]